MTTAIVLAGGLGTRLRSVVSDVPKPMAPIAGKPFLERLMDYWISQGVTKFVLSVGYLSHVITEHFGIRYGGASLVYSIEDKPLGTGGAVVKALQDNGLDQTTLLLNGDTFFEADLSKLFNALKGSDAKIAMGLMKTTDNQRYMGVDYDRFSQNILSLEPKKGAGDFYANAGVYLIDATLVKHLASETVRAQSLESDIFSGLISGGVQFCGVPFDQARFIDIGIPTDYERAQSMDFSIVSSTEVQ